MKFLIIPGFAKSGTTFLYDQLLQLEDKLNLPELKEIDYFRRGHSIEEYLQCFKSQDPGKVFLDASPQYSTAPNLVIKNALKALEGHEVKVLFGLREPLSRAYSHYLHDINRMFWVSALSAESFYHPDVLQKYFIPQKAIISNFVDAFSQKNVSAFGFGFSKNKLPEDVRKFLGLPKKFQLNLNRNPAPGSALPEVYYNAKQPTPLLVNGEYYILQAGDMLVQNAFGTLVYQRFSETLGNKIKQNSSNWTWRFDPEKLGVSIQNIQKSYLECFDVIGIGREHVKVPSVITAKPSTPLEINKIRNFKKWENVSEPLKSAMGEKNVKHYGESLASKMRDIQEASLSKDTKLRAKLVRGVIDLYGPIDIYVVPYLTDLIKNKEAEKAIDFLKAYPEVKRYSPVQKILPVFNHFGHKLPEKEFYDLAKLLKVENPNWRGVIRPAKKLKQKSKPTLMQRLDGRPIEIMLHHQCATHFVQKYMREFSDLNNMKFASTEVGRFSSFKGQKDADVICYSNSDYKHLSADNGTGLHIVRDPLAIVSSAYFSHLKGYPIKGWKSLETQRKKLKSLNMEEGIWATIKFLEKSQFYPNTNGPLSALAKWNFDDDKFYTIRCEDFVKFLERGLIKGWGNLYKGIEHCGATFNFPDPKKYTFQNVSGGSKIGQIDNSNPYRSGNPKNYLNHLTQEQIDYITKKYKQVFERFYPEILKLSSEYPLF